MWRELIKLTNNEWYKKKKTKEGGNKNKLFYQLMGRNFIYNTTRINFRFTDLQFSRIRHIFVALNTYCWYCGNSFSCFWWYRSSVLESSEARKLLLKLKQSRKLPSPLEYKRERKHKHRRSQYWKWREKLLCVNIENKLCFKTRQEEYPAVTWEEFGYTCTEVWRFLTLN